MKNLMLSIFLFLTLFLIVPSINAHPGNLSSDGCHYCWTNCAAWGYTYGTRHSRYGNTCNCYPPVDPLYCVPAPVVFVNPTPTSQPIFTSSEKNVGVLLLSGGVIILLIAIGIKKLSK